LFYWHRELGTEVEDAALREDRGKTLLGKETRASVHADGELDKLAQGFVDGNDRNVAAVVRSQDRQAQVRRNSRSNVV